MYSVGWKVPAAYKAYRLDSLSQRGEIHAHKAEGELAALLLVTVAELIAPPTGVAPISTAWGGVHTIDVLQLTRKPQDFKEL